jgi:hypothetical protein
MDNTRSIGPEFFLISNLLRLTSVSSTPGCPCPLRCLFRRSCACLPVLSSLSRSYRTSLSSVSFSPPTLHFSSPLPSAKVSCRHIIHIRTGLAMTPSPSDAGPPHPSQLSFSLPSPRYVSALLPHPTSSPSRHRPATVGSCRDIEGDNGAGGCVPPPSRTPSTAQIHPWLGLVNG